MAEMKAAREKAEGTSDKENTEEGPKDLLGNEEDDDVIF